jgi:transposase-like protein
MITVIDGSPLLDQLASDHVDTTGPTSDFRLTAGRDRQTAQRFLAKAIRSHGIP